MLKKEYISFVISIFILSLIAGYSVLAWQPAPLNPPSDNVGIPLNVGANIQWKDGGGLVLGSLAIRGGDPVQGKILTAQDADGITKWSNVSEVPGIISGSGDNNYIPIWTDIASLGNSVISQLGSNVGIGTTSPGSKLVIHGDNDQQIVSFRGTSQGENTNSAHMVSARAAGLSTGQYDLGLLISTGANPRNFWLKATTGTVRLNTDEITLTGDISGSNAAARKDISQGQGWSNAWSGIEMWGEDVSRQGEMMLFGNYISFRTGKTLTGSADETLRISNTGDISAPSNVWGTCATLAWTCDASQTCPDGRFVTRVDRGTTLALCGVAPTRWYQMRIRCCGI